MNLTKGQRRRRETLKNTNQPPLVCVICFINCFLLLAQGYILGNNRWGEKLKGGNGKKELRRKWHQKRVKRT